MAASRRLTKSALAAMRAPVARNHSSSSSFHVSRFRSLSSSAYLLGDVPDGLSRPQLFNKKNGVVVPFCKLLFPRSFHSTSPRFFAASGSDTSKVNQSEFTEMAWEGIIGAVDASRSNKQQVVETENLMKALLEQKDGLARRIFTKAGVDNSSVLQATNDFIDNQPKIMGDTSGPISTLLDLARRNKKDIETMDKKLEADIDEQKRCLEEIDELKASWLPKLRNLVGQINGTFSRNFQEMAVAGEVSLDEHGKDFDQYGNLIKVKFSQAGELKVLSAHHQSGGERSVSTIMYLVSLQDLTKCPFRVVDEINQGMDPINERKMFQQLVRATSQQNTPQYFLVTPKLLPDLEYSEACTILNIMNGPWIDHPSEVWNSGNCWSVVRGLAPSPIARPLLREEAPTEG